MTDPAEDLLKGAGFGKRMGFGRRPALVVVDVIKAFTSPGNPMAIDMAAEIEAIGQLMPLARSAGAPVVLVTSRYDCPDLSDAGVWPLKQDGSRLMAAGTGGSDFDGRLPTQAADWTVVKKYVSSFFGTDLAARLTARGVDTCVITGAATSGCVRGTALDAMQSGFRPMVVREAVADRSAAAARQSLIDIDAKYGDVVSMAETLAYFTSLTRGR